MESNITPKSLLKKISLCSDSKIPKYNQKQSNDQHGGNPFYIQDSEPVELNKLEINLVDSQSFEVQGSITADESQILDMKATEDEPDEDDDTVASDPDLSAILPESPDLATKYKSPSQLKADHIFQEYDQVTRTLLSTPNHLAKELGSRRAFIHGSGGTVNMVEEDSDSGESMLSNPESINISPTKQYLSPLKQAYKQNMADLTTHGFEDTEVAYISLLKILAKEKQNQTIDIEIAKKECNQAITVLEQSTKKFDEFQRDVITASQRHQQLSARLFKEKVDFIEL